MPYDWEGNRRFDVILAL